MFLVVYVCGLLCLYSVLFVLVLDSELCVFFVVSRVACLMFDVLSLLGVCCCFVCRLLRLFVVYCLLFVLYCFLCVVLFRLHGGVMSSLIV